MEVGIFSRRLFFHRPLRCPLAPSTLPSLRTINPPNGNFCFCSSKPILLGFQSRFRCRTRKTMATSSPSTFVQVKEKIELTEKEKQIFERLLQVLRHFNLQTQLRVAGGWVRDKLIGKQCYDIDIALDNMMGREFCEKVNEYLSSSGQEVQGIGIIQCNPDQSKHLETARMRLFDIWIDFVNLRSESYSENSRIPTMKFGTAIEDAYRRDLTINSLFYNINTNSVEDITGRGLSDLKFGRIVTPLPPKETFLDDPLRVLRAIRFGARFDFVLDGALMDAASCDEVKSAIANKISKERIGHEIDLMISGNQPHKAMSYICDLKLFWIVFSQPHNSKPALPEGYDSFCIANMGAAWNLLQSIGCENFSDDQRRLYLYGALFLPLRKFVYLDNKAKKIPLVNYIFRNSLKLKASDAETVMNLHNASERFQSLIPLVTNEVTENVEVDYTIANLDVPVPSRKRIMAGLILREIKGFWRVALLISMLICPKDLDDIGAFSDWHVDLGKSKELYRRAESIIIQLGLDNVWEMKPLVNGKDIMSILQLRTGGPQVREWQQKLLEWQLALPSGTAEEFLDWMKETHSKRAKLSNCSGVQRWHASLGKDPKNLGADKFGS